MLRLSKHKHHQEVLWKKGDPEPASPDPDTCYTLFAYYYEDDGVCWKDWD